MGKFKIRLRIQNLELDIEGSRDDVPQLTQAVGQQFAGILGPAVEIVEGEVVPESPTKAIASPEKSKPKRTTSNKRSPKPTGSDTDGQPLVWRHDAAKWAVPKQKWVTADKALWLLYVAGEETGTRELTAGQISNTFNTQFKQAKTIRPSNVARDFGKMKVSANAAVGEDTSKSPSLWYITEAGIKRVKELIKDTLSQGEDSE